MDGSELLRPGVAGRVAPRENSLGELSDLIRDLADLQRSLLDPATYESGLNEARYSVLRELRFRQSEGCSQSELARGLFLSESNLSTLLDRMVRDGLLERERSRLDRRKSIIRITHRGAELAERVRASECSLMAQMWNGLSDEIQLVLRRELEKTLKCGNAQVAASANHLVSMSSHPTVEEQHAAAG